MKKMRRCPLALEAIATMLALAMARPVSAQVPQTAHWELEGNRGSYCYWYLAEPAAARDEVPSGVVLTPASSVTGLPNSLVRFIQDEPRFGQYIPGMLCLGFFDKVTTDDHQVLQAKAGKPVIIATSAIAASAARGVAGAGWYMLGLHSDLRPLQSAARRAGFDMDGLDYLSKGGDHGDDPEVVITVEGATLLWSGHAIAQSSVGKTQSVSFGYAGGRGTSWQVQQETSPATSQGMVGGLQILGKSSLAKALRSSPYRPVGPQLTGGTTTWTFQYVTH